MNLRTVVTFKSSAFNTTETKDYFINPGCYGDDVASHVANKLSEFGCKVLAEPDQEDFGWFLDFEVPEGEHCFVIGYRPGDDSAEGEWIGWIEKKSGLVGSLLGGRNRGIAKPAIDAIHSVLVGSPEIDSIRWHFKDDFDRGKEDLGTPEP